MVGWGEGGARSHDGASSVLTPAFSLPSLHGGVLKGWRGTSFHLSVARWQKFQPHNSDGVTRKKRDLAENFAAGIRVIWQIRNQQPRAELI